MCSDPFSYWLWLTSKKSEDPERRLEEGHEMPALQPQNQVPPLNHTLRTGPIVEDKNMAGLADTTSDPEDGDQDYAQAGPDQGPDPYDLPAPVKTISSKELLPSSSMSRPPAGDKDIQELDDEPHKSSADLPIPAAKTTQASKQVSGADQAKANGARAKARRQFAPSLHTEPKGLSGRRAVTEDDGDEEEGDGSYIADDSGKGIERRRRTS